MSKFNKRLKATKTITPNKFYFITTEGANTEPRYFEDIKANKGTLKINDLITIIDINNFSKQQQNISNPKKIITDFQKTGYENFISSSDYTRYPEDEFVFIFDRDRQSFTEEQFRFVNLISKANKLEVDYNGSKTEVNVTIILSAPCFELWLLMHMENIDLNKKDEILSNDKVSKKHTYISKYISDKYSFNTKSSITLLEDLLKSSNKTSLLEMLTYAINESKIHKTTFEDLNTDMGTQVGMFLEKLINS